MSKMEFPENVMVDTIPFSKPFVNYISLEVLVKDKAYNLIFDSGSEKTLINSSIPSTKISTDTVFFDDIYNQPHPSFQVLLDTLKIGGIKVIQMDSYLQRDLNFDGIFGGDIMKELVWKIDLFNQKIYVTKDVVNFNLKDAGIPFRRKGNNIYIYL